MNELLGMDRLVDGAELARLVVRLAIDLGFTAAIVVFIYQRAHRHREFALTYYIFNIITFALCALLRKVPMELGFALGLFAVFGILRYRTEEIRIRDLTYLFISIGLGILHGTADRKVTFAELILVSSLILTVCGAVELRGGGRGEEATPVLYDNLGLLAPERRAELITDLSQRTGLTVVRVEIQRIDLLRDAAELTVYHKA